MTATTAPLNDVRVVTIALNLPGPAAAARLHELGAQVTTVLPPTGDPASTMAPTLYEALHRGQTMRALDLKTPEGREEMDALLEESDLLLTSHRASTLQRLGLDADATSHRHPRLCQVDIVGYPGDRADVPGHDLNYQAEAGILIPEGLPSVLVADMHGAERAVSAALAALLGRAVDGRGRHAQVSLFEAAQTLGLPWRLGLTGPDSPVGGASPFYARYPAAEGEVAVGALEPHFATALAEQLGIDPAQDPAAQLRARFLEHDAEHWQRWGEERGIPLTAVRRPEPSVEVYAGSP